MGACLPACSVEEGQDDKGSQPPQDEEQVQQPKEEAGVAEHKQPRKEHRLPGRRLGEGCILLPPLQAAILYVTFLLDVLAPLKRIPTSA